MLRSLLLALVLTVPTAAAAKGLRFEGRWDCGVATMTFTGTTYDAGEGPMTMQTIEGDGHEFTITFADGYAISVAVSDDERSLQWLSHASGDSFTCARLD